MAAAVCGKPPTFAVAFGGQLVLRQRGFPVELSGFTARVSQFRICSDVFPTCRSCTAQGLQQCGVIILVTGSDELFHQLF
ncbi:unnamed protein product [Lampetra fluviatilis]